MPAYLKSISYYDINSNWEDAPAVCRVKDAMNHSSLGIAFSASPQQRHSGLSVQSDNILSMFSRRTRWDLETNPFSLAVEDHRRQHRELLDLSASNPTTVGLELDK